MHDSSLAWRSFVCSLLLLCDGQQSAVMHMHVMWHKRPTQAEAPPLVSCRTVKVKDARFSSKAYGTHDYKQITIEGRVQFDLLQAIQRDHKLSSYSLNSGGCAPGWVCTAW